VKDGRRQRKMGREEGEKKRNQANITQKNSALF